MSEYKLRAEDKTEITREVDGCAAPYATVRRLTVRNLLADLDAARQEIAELRAEADREATRWQEGIAQVIRNAGMLPIDASGNESGDPLDWSTDQVWAAINTLDEEKAARDETITELTTRAEAAERDRYDGVRCTAEALTAERDAAVQRAEKAERELALMVEAEEVEEREAARLEAIAKGLREHSDGLIREAMGADGISALWGRPLELLGAAVDRIELARRTAERERDEALKLQRQTDADFVRATAQLAEARASDAAARKALPDDLRASGWAVAVHNDYRLGGEAMTFWLVTRGERAIKGEGRTDTEALGQIRAVLAGTPGVEAPAPVDERTLRDVLYAFSLAKPIPDADLLEEFTRRYPEHASELTDFAIELAVDAVRGNVDAEPDVVDDAVVRREGWYGRPPGKPRRLPDTKTSEDGEDHGGVGPAPPPGTNAAPASAPKSGDPSGCDAIYDKIDSWHAATTELELHEWLGMTWEEYRRWGESPPALLRGSEERGRAAEREEIAAWLRGEADSLERGWIVAVIVRSLADKIQQRGAAGAKGGG